MSASVALSAHQQVLDACQKVVRAGIWLLRNGYGRLGLLPYMAPSGCHWRIEFQPLGRPSQSFYRYSSGCEARYLEQHCGGTVRRDVSPAGLAQAILVSVPDHVQQRCKGPLAPATAVWLEELESVLAAGWLPSAFEEMSTSFARWDLTSPDASRAGHDMAPQPGYVPPGYEPRIVAPTEGVRPISKSASTNAMQRRGTRLLAMVHELHKVGYQQLRICAGRSVDCETWLCHLLPAQDVRDDGWMPRTLQRSLLYTSANGAAYFGWTDAANDDARTLAAKFLDRCPDLAAASAGTDWAYAGWLTTVLGEAEHGRLPEFYGGLDFDLPHAATPTPPPWANPEEWQPPPEEIGEFVPHHALHVGMLPPPRASWDDLFLLCQ